MKENEIKENKEIEERDFDENTPAILIQDLHKSYGKKEVLKGLNLEVKQGELFGFIGRNGAGKSTTIDCMIGLKKFNSGRIELLSYDVVQEPLLAKSHFGYVPSEPTVYEAMTGYEYLEFVASIYQISEGQFKANYKYLCNRLQLREEDLEVPASNYSHGMKQKLALISALIHEPKLMMMDEPSLGLAPLIVRDIFQIIKEINKQGVTILLIEQNANMALHTADKGYVMETGEIILEGSGKELLENPVIQEAYLGK